METQELINEINQRVDDLDLVAARRYMEVNIDLLKGQKHHLRKNARDLFEFLLNGLDTEANPLNPKELNAIFTINTYATRFDVRGLRRAVENNADLLMRHDLKYHLNTDAKILLEGMRAIQVS